MEFTFSPEGSVLHRLLFPASVILAGCGTLPSAPLLSTEDPQCTDDGGGLPISFNNWDKGGVAFATLPFGAAIAPPIQADGSSVFKITSTIPFKIRVIGCVPGADVNSLTPTFSLEKVSEDAGSNTPVTVVESSSAVDQGNTLRNAGEGQYLFNFSTKLSGFDGGGLTAGLYRLKISAGGTFADVVVQFRLR